MTYEEKLEKQKQERIKNYHSYQKLLRKEKLNKYGFDVEIPLTDDFNTKRGFFTNVWIYYKGVQIGTLSPNFNKNEIESMYILTEFRTQLGMINYSNELNNKEEITIKTDNHTHIQSALDELENIRKEIVKFYTY